LVLPQHVFIPQFSTFVCHRPFGVLQDVAQPTAEAWCIAIKYISVNGLFSTKHLSNEATIVINRLEVSLSPQ
jgi:hypothetical protein